MEDKEKQMLHDIHNAVIGNDDLGHEGLVKGFRRHDKWIRSADLRMAGFTGGIAVIVFLIEILFKK